MGRPWHEKKYLNEYAVDAAFEAVDREIERAAANCPADASGQLQRLVVEARREVVTRLWGQLADEAKPLREVLQDFAVWDHLPPGVREGW